MNLKPHAPLRWETFLAYGESGSGPRKQYASYVGAAGLYAIAEVTSLAIFLFGMLLTNPDQARAQLSILWAAAVFTAFLITIFSVFFQLRAASRTVVNYNTIVPKDLKAERIAARALERKLKRTPAR
jgi:FlaA1/EpsC-like NDP-sugar epimerase